MAIPTFDSRGGDLVDPLNGAGQARTAPTSKNMAVHFRRRTTPMEMEMNTEPSAVCRGHIYFVFISLAQDPELLICVIS